jgi:hypothetical protein
MFTKLNYGETFLKDPTVVVVVGLLFVLGTHKI